jgi:hypothetical protein
VSHKCSILWRVTQQPRRALLKPRSLTSEQTSHLTVTTARAPTAVHAWILWEDGVEELVQGVAIAWTRKAVRVRFGAPPHEYEVWVWAGAVERV